MEALSQTGDGVGLEERLFREVFEKAAVGMVLKDAAGRPVESNPALRRMLGYGEGELRGMARSDFTHHEDRTKDAQLYEELFRGERESFRVEKRYLRGTAALCGVA